MASDSSPIIPPKRTLQVFLALAAGQLFTLATLPLLPAYLGLEDFGKYGLCLVDFTVFAGLANFALHTVSVPYVVRRGLSEEAFSMVASTRLWTTLAAMAAYLAFESAFRSDRELLVASFLLAVAVAANPGQLEWWSLARGAYWELMAYRILAGAVTLGLVLLWVRRYPGLVSAAGSYVAGAAAGFAFLAWRSRRVRITWRGPGAGDMGSLWRGAAPLALTGLFEFLFVPLGYYLFHGLGGAAPLLGAYGVAHRITLAAAMFAGSLYMVLLPRFSQGRAASGAQDLPGPPARGRSGEDTPTERALASLFDRMALALGALLIPVPWLAAPALRILFPAAPWDGETLPFAAWALSCMAASICLHLLRMPPMTRLLAEGGSALYAKAFASACLANLASGYLGGRLAGLEYIPAFALAADLAFTGFFYAHLRRPWRIGTVWRLAAAIAALAAYLAWARYLTSPA